ncbi:MAG: thymidylate synthase [Candidatus Aenigmatarchaeota archaeon]
MFGPIYKASRLVMGNPESNVAIVTLWTRCSDVAKLIDKNKYAVIGNLYSAERGLDILIRNLLANPNITNIIMTGTDFSKSGKVMMDFFQNGFFLGKAASTEKPCWRVKSDHEGYVDLDIPEESLNLLRETVNIMRVDDIANFDFSSLVVPGKKREKQVFLKIEESHKKYIGEDIGYIIRGKTVTECWLKILDTIMKFGKTSGTQYEDDQKELINIMSVISDEDPHNLHIPDFLPCDRQHVTDYIPRITTDTKPADIKYTYGTRMRSWFGTDQVRGAVEKLARQPISRAIVISLWDPKGDLTIGGSPCLNHIWLRLRDGKLHMTCIFRSHDMFEGYPDNAFGLRVLQEEIRQELIEKGIEASLGNLVIISQSAHIYSDCWSRCEQIVAKYLTKEYTHIMRQLDPRGNLVITISEQQIRVEYVSPEGETLGVYLTKTAAEMCDVLSREGIISLVPHALDIGIELMKAEAAIKLGTEYIQDEEMKFGK